MKVQALNTRKNELGSSNPNRNEISEPVLITSNVVGGVARVKGHTENAILAMGFADAGVFRPGMIRPRRGTRHNVPLYRWSTIAFTPFMPLARAMGSATSTVEIGRAMIAAALGEHVGEPQKLRLDSGDINALAKRMPT